jgi:hypothetical protein
MTEPCYSFLTRHQAPYIPIDRPGSVRVPSITNDQRIHEGSCPIASLHYMGKCLCCVKLDFQLSVFYRFDEWCAVFDISILAVISLFCKTTSQDLNIEDFKTDSFFLRFSQMFANFYTNCCFIFRTKWYNNF